MNIVINDYYKNISAFASKAGFYEYDEFKGLMEYFKYLIIDSLIMVADCELYHKIEPSRRMGKPNILSSNDCFRSSINLKLFSPAWSSISSYNVSVFLIRQSIELKIKNALGINYILDKNGYMTKIPGDKLMEFFFNNKNIELPNIKKSIVRKIHNWTQYFVHGGYVLNIWQIDIAHNLIKPLYTVGDKNGTLSIFWGIKIKKKYYETEFKKELEMFIKNTFFNRKEKFILKVLRKIKLKKQENNLFSVIYMTPEALLY
jgi:hypothetical protein